MSEEEIKDEVVEDVVTQPEENEEKEVKTFTQEEMNAVVEKRVAREARKHEELKEKAEREKKQAKELAKLSAEKRAEKEFELEKEEFQRQKSEFRRERLELQTTKELDTRGLPVGYAKYVIGEDAESTQELINEFEKLRAKDLEKHRINAMRGKTPNTGKQPGFKNPFSKEHLNLTEQSKIIKEDPKRAESLRKQANK